MNFKFIINTSIFLMNIFFIKRKIREITVKENVQVQIAHVLIQTILLHGFDVCIISIVKLNRYAINVFIDQLQYNC